MTPQTQLSTAPRKLGLELPGFAFLV
jgi:hypothetical protein